MTDKTRARKLAETIREVLALRLEKGLRDPRLGFVTLTEVRLTGDLHHATVFYTVLGSDRDRQDSQKALLSATSYLRRQLASRLRTRLTPTLEFVLDALPEKASHLEGLVEEAIRRDKLLADTARNATHVGDTNPYRDESKG